MQLPGLGTIVGRYDAVLSDVWGVIHNGVEAHRSAVDALLRVRQAGRPVVLITNAPRPADAIVGMLDALHVPRDAYDAIASSGDVTRRLIARYPGQVIHYVGPAEQQSQLLGGLDIKLGPPEAARAVVIADLDDDDDTPEMYHDRMGEWLKHDLPLIVANPDRVVEHGGRLVYCGGAVADLYEARGGRIIMAGKPYRPIYEEALRLAELAAGRSLDRTRILAIGDSVRTDAIGAAGFGVDLFFISGSIHAEELDAFGNPDPAAIEALVAPSGARLAGHLPLLGW